jgi:hypothetical protein
MTAPCSAIGNVSMAYLIAVRSRVGSSRTYHESFVDYPVLYLIVAVGPSNVKAPLLYIEKRKKTDISTHLSPEDKARQTVTGSSRTIAGAL